MSELSLVELESELCAELPARNLLRRRSRRSSQRGWGYFPSASAHASYGSAANANATYQINFNPQIVINNGAVGAGGIKLSSFNTNANTNQQTGLPINFGIA